MRNNWQERLRELEMQAAITENERAAIADAEAKKQVALRIENARAAFVERTIKASELATQRALEILRQPIADSKPGEAAKLFSEAHNIGSAVLGLPGQNLNVAGLTGAAPIHIQVVLTRDEQSARVDALTREFLIAHPEHPQHDRMLKELDDARQFDIENGLVQPSGEPFPLQERRRITHNGE